MRAGYISPVMETARFDRWLGRERRRESRLDAWPSRALIASLGLDSRAALTELPILWHWLYFPELPSRERSGRDGHALPGDFFPPMSQPRRMFVGARSRCHRPLRLGEPASLTETILRCESKTGSSGAMTLLTVGYAYRQADRDCVTEERQFMYLPDRTPAPVEVRPTADQPVPDAPLHRDMPTDPVLLFRFSALTFNSHRIHYDSDYARQVEGYPERVVHGPLTALLLAELAAENVGAIRRFSFRARAPLFAGDTLRLRGECAGADIILKAYRPDGQVAMTAEAAT